ncbi:MAG: hypothetical protein ACK504_07810 [Bacteroidota bacterium]|jgi:glutathione synthase/RimK-type ligase-like ATP-grasp enzyme
MILILSTAYDHSTSSVIEWLIYLNKNFVRLNFENTIEIKYSSKNGHKEEITLYNNHVKFTLDDITSYWYRRGDFSISYKNLTKVSQISKVINEFNYSEVNAIKNFLHIYLRKHKKKINDYNDIFLNKIYVLEQAKKIGLKVPTTIISSKKSDVVHFINEFIRKYTVV